MWLIGTKSATERTMGRVAQTLDAINKETHILAVGAEPLRLRSCSGPSVVGRGGSARQTSC